MALWSAATARRAAPAPAAPTRPLSDRPAPDRRPLPAPAPVSDEAVAGLKQILRIETEIRAAPDVGAIARLAVEHLRSLVSARQAFLMRIDGGAPRVEAVAGSSVFTGDAPVLRWLERVTARAVGNGGEAVTFNLAELDAPGDRDGVAHPFPFALWTPIRLRGAAATGGLLCLREGPWSEGDMALAARLAEMTAHAGATLADGAPARPGGAGRAGAALATVMVALVLSLYPLTWRVTAAGVTAPVDLRAVAAPSDGVITGIHAPADRPVAAGDIVARLDDAPVRARLAAAEREVARADEALRQAQRAALVDLVQGPAIVPARARLAERRVERDNARVDLAATVIRAPVDGMVYPQPTGLLGRTVRAGEELFAIAPPGRVELRFAAFAADLGALAVGDRLRVLLADDPALARSARVTGIRPAPAGTASGDREIVARLTDGLGAPPPGIAATITVSERRQAVLFRLIDWFGARPGGPPL